MMRSTTSFGDMLKKTDVAALTHQKTWSRTTARSNALIFRQTMVTPVLLFLSLLGSQGGAKPQAPGVTLTRVSKANEKLAYSVRSHLQVEYRQIGLQTWIPENLDYNYAFTTLVTQLKADGMAEMK